MEIVISRYNDPYLDNALQSFYRMLTEIEEQYPDVVESKLVHNTLKITIKNKEAFIDRLDELIKEETKLNLFYSRKNRDGTTSENWKHYLPFRSQPPSQFPKTFKEDTRKKLIELAFSEEITKVKRNPCFLCGKYPGSEELTQGVYPFVTKTSALTTATYLINRSISKSYHKVCPLCYLIASVGWLDPILPYRSRVSVAPRQTVSFLWLPYTTGLLEELDKVKRELGGGRFELKDEISNIRLEVPYEGYPPSRFSLLLSFLESILLQVADREVRTLKEVYLRIPDEWWLLCIPEGGGIKNVDLWAFSLPIKIKNVIMEYIPKGRIYGELFCSMGLRQDGERRDRDEERRRSEYLREGLSRAFLSDDYSSFARQFQLSPRWIIILPPSGEEKLVNLIKVWRCRDMLTEEELEVLRKAGRCIALISDLRKKPSVLYNVLDRVRTPSDLLEVLREIGHLLVGVDFQESDAQYLSPDSLDQLVELVNGKEKLFSDIKNTLGIFISVEYAKRKLRERRQEK